MSKLQSVLPSRDFYNFIAPVYNDQVVNYPQNDRIRSDVAAYFKQVVPTGRIMDFGGGTGLDLPWLLESDYEIVFCEPAEGMRVAAKESVDVSQQEKIFFLDSEKTDFHQWSSDHTLFPVPVDAVLANFAVLNCIEDIEMVFQKLAGVMKPGGHLIACIIDARFYQLITRYFRSYVKSLLSGGKIITYTHYKDVIQKAYLYPPEYLKTASKHSFAFQNLQPLGGFGFIMMHFTRM
jgi:ubiquinone/menaquinone biosynthesis C-methylase UbiE